METCISQRKTSDFSHYGLLTPSVSLDGFLGGLQTPYLNGFCSTLADKFVNKVSALSFDQAKQIHMKIISKGSLKEKKNWKSDELTLLLYLVDKSMLRFGKTLEQLPCEAWEQIGILLQNRSGQSCQQKALSLAPSNLNERPWSEEQQEKLAQIIQKEGSGKWKKISIKLFQANPHRVLRTSKQCRERYMCFLQPKLKKGFWTDSEDLQLIHLFLEHGRKWSRIAQDIEGRNENAIKNRFFLLFEESKKGGKLYHSQFMRRIMRKKQKLQKSLSQNISQNTMLSPPEENQFIEIDRFLNI